jgi:hypothetical protein
MAPTSGTSSSSLAYPEDPLLDLPTAFSSLTCLQRGLCPVSSLQGSQLQESHSLYYEVHGSPATAAAIAPHAGGNEVTDNVSPKKLKNKMVFIMGLNSSCFSWGPQVRRFGGGVPRTAGDEEEEEYTALVFDNRGVGNSGYPRGPYT